MRLIDADKAVILLQGRLIETANNNCGFKCDAGSVFQDAAERIPRWIDEIPTADADPVVRCKDCKWWRKDTDHTCRKWGGASPRKANGFCDDGERMKNEQIH